MVRNKTGPTSLVRRAESSAIVGVEELKEKHESLITWSRKKIIMETYFVEPNIVPEMRIEIKLGIASIRGSTTVRVSAKYVDNPMLYFFRDSHKIHIISASCRTFYLKLEYMRSVYHEKMFNQSYLEIVAIVLIESLQTLDQQEISGEPCEKGRKICQREMNGGKSTSV